MYTILVWVKLKTPPKNSKIPPKNTKRAKIKTEFFCIFGIIFFFGRIYVLFEVLFVFLGGGGAVGPFLYFLGAFLI
jgi:hypothetical protein